MISIIWSSFNPRRVRSSSPPIFHREPNFPSIHPSIHPFVITLYLKTFKHLNTVSKLITSLNALAWVNIMPSKLETNGHRSVFECLRFTSMLLIKQLVLAAASLLKLTNNRPHCYRSLPNYRDEIELTGTEISIEMKHENFGEGMLTHCCIENIQTTGG